MTNLCNLILATTLVLLSLATPEIAMAQSETGSPSVQPALPDPLTPEAVREMVARMSDDQVRGMLLERLDAVAKDDTKSTPAKTSLIQNLQKYWTAFSFSVTDAVTKLPTLFGREAEAVSLFASRYGSGGLVTMFAYIAIALAAGFAAERVVNMLTRRWQGSESGPGSETLASSLRFLFRRFVREILGLIVFYFVMRTVGRALLSPEQMAFAAPFVTYLIWFPRLGAAISRFILAPGRSDLRLVNANDRWAKYLYRNVIGLFLLGGFTIFAVDFNLKNGITGNETRLGFWLDSAVYVYLIIIAWQARDGLIELMRGRDPEPSRYDAWVARVYPTFAMLAAAGMWLLVNILVGLDSVDKLLLGAHYTTLFWLLMAPALETLVRGLVRYLVPPMIGEGPVAEAAYMSTKRSYIRIGRVLVGLIVVMLIANSWDIDIRSLVAAGVGDSIGAHAIEFIVTCATGYVLYEAMSVWVNRRLAREQTAGVAADAESGGEGGGAGKSRLATVLPLLLVTGQVAIAVIFGLLAVGTLGIDITPLLAGAGILGLAIGFGAQKLVTDVVSGIFFLIDDAFRVGEYVDVGGTMGTVEKISIRSMQLRHHRGLVHTIPYGEIPKLTNFSRDWVIMKLMFTVPFDTDPNKVKKIFKKIGAEMMEDPLYKDDFLEPFKSQGVFQFDDVGIVMRGKFMAKPGTQFTLRKEIYNRVRNEFKANGIEFARREVRVAIPGLEHDENLSEEEKKAISAAAAQAVQQQVEKEQTEKQQDK